MDIGVVVGRFQVDDLHDGHKSLLDFARSRHPNLVIFIGVPALEGTRNNPLSYQLREQMIREYCPKATILPIYDVYDNKLWSITLDKTIKKLYYGSMATLYSGRNGFKESYHGEFEVVLQNFPENIWSGTEVRERIGKSPEHQASFRAGVIHQTQKTYSNVKMCVDIAAMRSGKVLLGHKNGEESREIGKLWRFPGGQLDPDDKDLEEAGKRELYEETGLICEGKLKYLNSFLVGDWRNVGTGLATFTALFTCQIMVGGGVARDDLDEIKWFPIDNETRKLIVSEHNPLFCTLINNQGENK